jgi:hypothetical protein
MFSTLKGIDPYWFIGEVVDKNDPTNSGRVRVRAIGIHPPSGNEIHTDKTELDGVEDQDLPWAFCVNGTYGKLQAIPDESDWVFGFFADGRDAQHPFIIGTLFGQNIDDNGAGNASSGA